MNETEKIHLIYCQILEHKSCCYLFIHEIKWFTVNMYNQIILRKSLKSMFYIILYIVFISFSKDGGGGYSSKKKSIEEHFRKENFLLVWKIIAEMNFFASFSPCSR